MAYDGETQTVPLSDRLELKRKAWDVPKSPQHPAGVKFAVVGRVDGRSVIRVDNYPHHGMGTHVHIGKRVLPLPDITNPTEATTYVERFLVGRYQR